VFSDVILYVVALSDIRNSVGGDQLSYATARFCAELLLMPDPKVQTTNEMTSPYKAGGQREFPRHSLEGIAKSVSKCHDVNQGLFHDQLRMRKEFNLKLRNMVVITILGWGPAIAAFLYTLLR
jgi:hypothetical protein